TGHRRRHQPKERRAEKTGRRRAVRHDRRRHRQGLQREMVRRRSFELPGLPLIVRSRPRAGPARHTSMNTSLIDILQSGWIGMLLRGAGMTILISLCGIALGAVIGIAGAAAKIGGSRPVRGLVGLCTLIVRSVPELLIIYLLFFGTVQPAAD